MLRSNNGNTSTGPRQRSSPCPIDFSRVCPNYVRGSRYSREEEEKLTVKFAELLRSNESSWPKSLNEFVTGRRYSENRFEYITVKHLGPDYLKTVVPKTPGTSTSELGPYDHEELFVASKSCRK